VSAIYRYRYRRQPGASGPETIVIESAEEKPAEILDYKGWYFDRQRGERVGIVGNYRRVPA
jgi:hypothetical protein